MTAHYTTETAVEAIRKGAAEYLNKPISLATLRDRVGRIIDAALLRQQARHAEEQIWRQRSLKGLWAAVRKCGRCFPASGALRRITALP